MNNIIFNGESKNREDIAFKIILKIVTLASIKKVLEHLSMDSILNNWEVCLGSGCLKEEILSHLVSTFY